MSSRTPICFYLWHSPAAIWSISNTFSMHQVNSVPLLPWNRLILGSCNKQCRLISSLSSLTGNRPDFFAAAKKHVRNHFIANFTEMSRNQAHNTTGVYRTNRFFPVSFQIFCCCCNNNNFLPNIRSHRSSTENVSQWIYLNLYQCFLIWWRLFIGSFLLGFYWFYEMTIKLIHSYVIKSHKSRTYIQIECSMAIARRACQDEVHCEPCKMCFYFLFWIQDRDSIS